MAFVVLYDACVLYPAPLRDLLVRLANTGVVRARWSAAILDECFRNILENRPELKPEALQRTRELMTRAVPECMVTGFEQLIDGLVLAAAIRAGAQAIVTFNLDDFPAERLQPYNIEAMHPDEFVIDTIDHSPNDRAGGCLVGPRRTWDLLSMSRAWVGVLGWVAVVCSGCGAGSQLAPPTASGGVTGCEIGAPLAGAAYDINKSRFAFGSTPTRADANGFVRWVGVDGVVAIQHSGGELGSLNGGAPEAGLPDWSDDPMALASHVTDYFATFGVSACQVGSAPVNGGSGGRTITLVRSVDGIVVGESLAYARFDSQDQSTSEGLYWPMIPADVVTSARALHEILADPTGLAAYKARLPANAQGDGTVILHHTNSASTSPFAAAATYDVYPPAGPLGLPSVLSFDPDGYPVSTNW